MLYVCVVYFITHYSNTLSVSDSGLGAETSDRWREWEWGRYVSHLAKGSEQRGPLSGVPAPKTVLV